MSKKKFFRYIVFLFRVNRGLVILCAVLVLSIAAVELISPLVIRNIIDKGITEKNTGVLYTSVSIYIVLELLFMLSDLFSSVLFSRMRNRATVRMRVTILRRLSLFSGEYYVEKSTGEILSTIQSDIDIIENIDYQMLFMIAKNIATAIFSIYLMMSLKIDLFIFVLLIQSSLVLVQRKITKEIHSNVSRVRQAYGEISNIAHEYVSDIMNVIMARSKKFFISKYIEKLRILTTYKIKTDVLYSTNITSALFVDSLIRVFLFGYGGVKVIKSDMTIGDLIAFQSYISMLIGPCMSIVNSNNRIQQAIISLERVYSIMDRDSDLITKGRRKICKDLSIDKIELEDIWFRYTDSYVIHGIDAVFRRGEKTAIVGGSGCGKSTIVNLIYGFWKVDKGKIRIGEYDLDEVNIKSLRRKVAIVSQNGLVFDASLKDNICLGKKISQDILFDVCQKVGLYDFIMSSDEKFDTLIGEKGVKLSGGQKQRISIARALIQESDILIFDEATSALDNVLQNEIIRNLDDFMRDKIVIIVAHRLSTIRNSDKIYVMKDGRIVESGNHEQLMNSDSEYRRMYVDLEDSY